MVSLSRSRISARLKVQMGRISDCTVLYILYIAGAFDAAKHSAQDSIQVFSSTGKWTINVNTSWNRLNSPFLTNPAFVKAPHERSLQWNDLDAQ